VARILIVGGGCRGRRLASELTAEGHALRITCRSDARRDAIEQVGAECWIGTPQRLETLRAALENVTIACWLLASAHGDAEELGELHSSRLEAFVRLLIDTTVRGFVYEAGGGGASPELAAQGEGIVRGLAAYNVIPHEVIRADPTGQDQWLEEARAALSRLLVG
jgi:hypothetical protein